VHAEWLRQRFLLFPKILNISSTFPAILLLVTNRLSFLQSEDCKRHGRSERGFASVDPVTLYRFIQAETAE